MKFQQYPLDTQNFSLILQSYAYDSKFLHLSFINGEAVTENYSPQYPDPMIELNQLWTYQTYNAYIYNKPSSSPTNKKRQYSTAVIDMTFTRQKYGESVILGYDNSYPIAPQESCCAWLCR